MPSRRTVKTSISSGSSQEAWGGPTATARICTNGGGSRLSDRSVVLPSLSSTCIVALATPGGTTTSMRAKPRSSAITGPKVRSRMRSTTAECGRVSTVIESLPESGSASQPMSCSPSSSASAERMATDGVRDLGGVKLAVKVPSPAASGALTLPRLVLSVTRAPGNRRPNAPVTRISTLAVASLPSVSARGSAERVTANASSAVSATASSSP